MTDTLTLGNRMFEQREYRYAVVLYWHGVRSRLFNNLFSNQVPFTSSEDAIRKVLLLPETSSQTGVELIELYTLATMAEWDGNFVANKKIASSMKTIATKLYEHFE
jgi:hypothetical protein